MLTTRKKPSSIANERVTQSSPNRIISKVQFVHNNKVKKYNEKTESVGSIPTTYHYASVGGATGHTVVVLCVCHSVCYFSILAYAES